MTITDAAIGCPTGLSHSNLKCMPQRSNKQYSTVLYNWLTLVRQHMQSHDLYMSFLMPAPKTILPMKAYLQVFIHIGMPTNYIAVS